MLLALAVSLLQIIMEIRKDILGNTPKLGDIIAYNPPRYKGLRLAYITGFNKPSGLPTIVDLEDLVYEEGTTYNEKFQNWTKYYDNGYVGDTPKTGFVIAQNNTYEIY